MSLEREGKTFWPHCIVVRFDHVLDVEEAVLRGVRWLRENGTKSVAEREPFVIQTMGEIVETDPDLGTPLKRKI